jgi:anthranilate/para-aminobenzoate synthase component I
VGAVISTTRLLSRSFGTDVGAFASYAARAHEGTLSWLDGNDGSSRGRFSFLGVRPVETIVVRADDPDPLAVFDRLEAEREHDVRGEAVPGLAWSHVPRWIGAIAYDLAWSLRASLGLRRAPVHARAAHTRPGAPLAFFHRYDALLVGDAQIDEVSILADDEAAANRLSSFVTTELLASSRAEATVGPLAVEPREVHARSIEAALELVRDGIVYQINLARRWSASVEGLAPGRALAAASSLASPVPQGAYLELGDRGAELALASRSMERFLSWDRVKGVLETRPIKGTIAASPTTREARERALLADPKERAEHAMIVDLMRNDLGRVAETGGVEVAGAFEVEPYRHLHHLVSTVRARTRRDATLREVLLATFPPGSVTGTPKLSAIEHIEALERFPRGFYCGAIGHVDRSGGLDLSVAIRTMQLTAGELTYFAGGGLVDASDVTRELDETELKARVLEDTIASLRR